jgi:hypothetical protein
LDNAFWKYCSRKKRRRESSAFWKYCSRKKRRESSAFWKYCSRKKRRRESSAFWKYCSRKKRAKKAMDANKSFSIYFLLLATMLVHCQGWKKSKYWGLQDGAPKNKPCYSWMCQDRTITTTGNIIIIFYFVSLHTNIYCYTVVGF